MKTGETVLILGASGGIGHMAVQLAQRMGARVLAVASGADGVDLVKQLGAEIAIDGHQDDIEAAVLDKGMTLTRKEKRAHVEEALPVHQMALF